MKARLKWIESFCFMGEAESGHAVLIDGDKKRGVSPMELILLGTAGCTSYDVISILQKARQDVRDVQVEITAERAERDPKVYTHIHFHFIVTGQQVGAEHVRRALKLSAEKYCSA